MLKYLEITSLQRVSFLGDSVTVFEGMPNPWMLWAENQNGRGAAFRFTLPMADKADLV